MDYTYWSSSSQVNESAIKIKSNLVNSIWEKLLEIVVSILSKDKVSEAGRQNQLLHAFQLDCRSLHFVDILYNVSKGLEIFIWIFSPKIDLDMKRKTITRRNIWQVVSVSIILFCFVLMHAAEYPSCILSIFEYKPQWTPANEDRERRLLMYRRLYETILLAHY